MKNNKFLLLVFVSLIFCFIIAPIIVKASISELDLKSLVKGADLILVGKVITFEPKDIGPKYSPPLPRYIVTYVILEVENVIKGSLDTSYIVIFQRGGRLSNEITIPEDEAIFQPEERCLLFLSKTYTGEYCVFGGEQGKFTIINGRIADRDDKFRATKNKSILLNDAIKEIKKILSSN